MRYVVVVEEGEENWSGYVPDLPGCIATGSSRAEVEQRLREAIPFHLESLALHGDPIPAPGSWTTEIEVEDMSFTAAPLS